MTERKIGMNPTHGVPYGREAANRTIFSDQHRQPEWAIAAGWFLSRKPIVRFLKWFAEDKPYFDIYDKAGEKLYMRRWWLVPGFALQRHPKGWLEPKPWWPWRWRLHHIVRPDADRHFHSHPSDFRTFVLRGWYVAEIPRLKVTMHGVKELPVGEGRLYEYKCGSTGSLKADEWHVIHSVSNPLFHGDDDWKTSLFDAKELQARDWLEYDCGVWTFFCLSNRKESEWGFLVDGEKVHWREYLGVPKVEPSVWDELQS